MNLLQQSPILLLWLLSIGYTGQAQNRFPVHPQQENFQNMADYLSRGTGKWRADNPRYNPNNPRSAKAFGLWFEKPLNNLLTIKIVAYQADTTLISSQGIFAWDPHKKIITHITSDRGGGYSQGVSEFPDDSTFISIMKLYRPGGRMYHHKDENFLIDENEHRNTSFKKDHEGQWVETGNWVWYREKE